MQTQITRETLLANSFSFGRVLSEGREFLQYGQISFSPNGLVLSYLNQNEVYWSLGRFLSLWNEDRVVTQSFRRFEPFGETEIAIGRYVEPGFTHYLCRHGKRSLRTMRYKILIATHHRYQRAGVLEPLMEQLRIAGFAPDDIVVVVNEAPSVGKEIREGTAYHGVDHNSWEYSALIVAAEVDLDADYFVLLHDTCLVGARFKESVECVDVAPEWDVMAAEHRLMN
jgi:hypothetical protein